MLEDKQPRPLLLHNETFFITVAGTVWLKAEDVEKQTSCSAEDLIGNTAPSIRRNIQHVAVQYKLNLCFCYSIYETDYANRSVT